MQPCPREDAREAFSQEGEVARVCTDLSLAPGSKSNGRTDKGCQGLEDRQLHAQQNDITGSVTAARSSCKARAKAGAWRSVSCPEAAPSLRPTRYPPPSVPQDSWPLHKPGPARGPLFTLFTEGTFTLPSKSFNCHLL